MHLVSHLPHYVKLFGPLWTHSAFAFEDSIGHLVKKAHGTHDIANQVSSYIAFLCTRASPFTATLNSWMSCIKFRS